MYASNLMLMLCWELPLILLVNNIHVALDCHIYIVVWSTDFYVKIFVHRVGNNCGHIFTEKLRKKLGNEDDGW